MLYGVQVQTHTYIHLYTYATYTLHSGMHCTIHAQLNSKPGKRCGGNTYDMFEEEDGVSKLMDSGLQHWLVEPRVVYSINICKVGTHRKRPHTLTDYQKRTDRMKTRRKVHCRCLFNNGCPLSWSGSYRISWSDITNKLTICSAGGFLLKKVYA